MTWMGLGTKIHAGWNCIFTCRSSVAKEIKKHLGFWNWTYILFFLSTIVVLGISFLFHLPYYLENHGFPYILYNSSLVNPTEEMNFGLATIWSSGDNARYILSSLSQVQAAIFGIFFTLNFIIFQIKIPNCSPNSIKKSLSSSKLIFILIVFISSISFDLISIRYIKSANEINVFWALSLSIFAVLILIPYMRITLMDLVKESLIEEIYGGNSRHNLEDVDLSGISIDGVNLQNRVLIKSNLNGSHLSWVDMSHSNLEWANLSYMRLTQVKLNQALLYHANLRNSSITSTELKEASLFGADLSGTRFMDVDLSRAHLSGANLIGTDFSNTNLNGTRIREEWSDVVDSKMAKYILKYDEITVETLIRNKNVDVAIVDGRLKEDLIKRARELLHNEIIDADLEASLNSFLLVQGELDLS